MSRRNCLLVLAAAVFFTFAPAGLGAAEPAPLSLPESIEIALRQSVLIHAAGEGARASEARRKEAFTNFLPKLSTSYSYQRLNEPPETKSTFTTPPFTPLVVGTRDNYLWALEVRQPVFAGGGIVAGYKMSKLEAQAARYDESTTIQDIIEEVQTSYFMILKAERIRGVARQSIEQLKAHYDVAGHFFQAGLIPKNDLLNSEVQFANGQQALVRAENDLELARARFNTVLRREINTPVAVQDILVYRPFTLSLSDCLKTAFDKRPELKAANLRLDESRKAVSLAQSEYYPTVNLVGAYGRFGDTPDVQGSSFQNAESWSVLAIANWNFWEWGRTKYRVDAGRNRLNQASDLYINLQDRISLEVQNAYLLLRESEKRIGVAQRAIASAEENFRINQERYREQVATSTDVLDAQTLLTRARSDYFNALSDFNISEARLERAMGIIFKE